MRPVLIASIVCASAIASAAPDEPAVAQAVQQDWSAKLIEEVDRVAKEVGHLRGLPRKKPIKREVVSIEDLRKRLADNASNEKNAAELASESIALERWGVLPIGTDYGAMLVDVLTEQIAGYYDHDARTLYIASRDPAAADPDSEDWGEMLLSHEIDHALTDQSFDLGKLMKLPDGEGDAELARRALVEGDGMALMIEYLLADKGKAAPWTDPDLTSMLMHTMDADGPASAHLGAAPLWVRENLIFPYRAGLAFVASIRRRHPWSSVDAAYRRPPRSTEQILHPELYRSDDKPIAIKLPALLPELRKVWTDVWGEERWGTFLRAHGVADATALEAAAGWGGDRLAVYAREGDDDPLHAIGVAHTAWDSDVDAQEATEALVRALDAFAGAAAERTDDGGRWIDDGRVSWVERRGKDVMIVVGCPAPLADDLRAQLWTAPAKRPRR
ncbi:MAG TPA: hypothetical protein VL463_03470 [Kofleriaceae bacterium]|nr:hypothetical protein [Kofleriaceae bacterium]